MDGEDLLEAALHGQPWAGHAIVTVYAPALTHYANVTAPHLSQADREKAVESAITRAVRRIDSYNPHRATFATWLRPFVRHALADLNRTQGPSEPLPEQLPDTVDPTTEESPQATAIRRALTRLSDTDQLIIALREYERLSYDHCADVIGGVSAQACRVRHHRALRRLATLASQDPALAAYLEVDPT